jgi:hypothetical protein
VFVLQLAVNALWSWLFFAWHLGAWAFADVLLLLALIMVTIVLFRRVRPLAAWLLLPYLAWGGVRQCAHMGGVAGQPRGAVADVRARLRPRWSALQAATASRWP